MERIYLDANATTPVLPEVLEAMVPYLAEGFGNPSSAHQGGQRTRAAVERARAQVASLLACSAKEVVFTSGGTESNNLALTGVLQPWLDRGEPAHLVTTQIEHHAVLFAAEALQRRGCEVTYLAPNRAGFVEPGEVEAALRPHTRLVSVMLANNETGTIQPLGKIARLAQARGVLVHTDAVQAAGKLQLRLNSDLKHVHLLSLSGHKLYAPLGTGALFVRAGVQLAPMLYGGPQERGRRAGTENVPGIVALGRASQAAQAWLAQDGQEGLAALRDQLETSLLRSVPGAVVNAAGAARVANTTNLHFPGTDAEALLIALDIAGIAASYGAACQSGAVEPSHVLLAMGLTPADARSSLRFSLLRTANAEEIKRASTTISEAVGRLASLVSPAAVQRLGAD